MKLVLKNLLLLKLSLLCVTVIMEKNLKTKPHIKYGRSILFYYKEGHIRELPDENIALAVKLLI